MFPAERGQLGRSASLEENRNRELAQFNELLRSGRIPPLPMFDNPAMAFMNRPFAPPPLDVAAMGAAQRELFMQFMANPEAARLSHPAFPYLPAMFPPFGGFPHPLAAQAAMAQAHLAAAAQESQQRDRERHRDRETKSPREHKHRDRDHSSSSKGSSRHHEREPKDRGEQQDRRDSPRPSSASGRSSSGSSGRRENIEQSYRYVQHTHNGRFKKYVIVF